jgi:hypothetical protein
MWGRINKAQLLLASTLVLSAGSAAAQTFTTGASGPALGNVAAGSSGDTVFEIDASTGLVTVGSGFGQRVSIGAAYGVATISCGNTNSCNGAYANVKIGSLNTSTGRAGFLSNFTVAPGSGTPTNISGTDPVSFRIGPFTKNSSLTVQFGADFPIKSSGTTGAAQSRFYVSAVASPSTPSSTGTARNATATVYRAISLAKNANLSFGRIVRPNSGDGWVELAPTGARTNSGAVWLLTPSPTRAQYTVSGEGGRVLDVDIPATFQMTSPGGGSVTVTTNNNLAATPTLGSSLGNAGTLSFFVGGRLDLDSDTPGGAYTGTFVVTTSYN